MSAKSWLWIVAIMTLSCAISLLLIATTSAALGQVTDGTVAPVEGPIDVVLYIESRCMHSSQFIKNHLMPFYEEHPTVIHELKIVPFGIAECIREPSTGDVNCTCQHRKPECDMNQLMNCIMAYRPRSEHLGMIACIQGRIDLDDASRNCIKNLSQTEQDKLLTCTKSQMGAQLHYEAGKMTKKAGVNWVPWIEVG